MLQLSIKKQEHSIKKARLFMKTIIQKNIQVYLKCGVMKKNSG
jgi:hypothetical protein